MIRIASAILVFLGITAAPLWAQTSAPCQDHFAASVQSVAEPLAANTATYANGAIRILRMDVGAPACCPEYLVVLHPAGSQPDEQYRICTLISTTPDLGFSRIDFAGRATAYDPARGLTISLPVEVSDGASAQWGMLNVTINQATGQVLLD